MVCGIEHRLWHFEEMGMGNEVLDERIIQGETKQEEEMLKTLSIAAGCLTDMPAAQESSSLFIQLHVLLCCHSTSSSWHRWL